MSRVYLDTSAYMALLLGETQASAVNRRAKKRTLCTSVLLFVEAERTLVHLVRGGRLSANRFESAFVRLGDDVDLFLLRDITMDLCLSKRFPLARTPKSADLIHLRTAEWFLQNGGLDDFVSLDDSQNRAATDMGLPIRKAPSKG